MRKRRAVGSRHDPPPRPAIDLRVSSHHITDVGISDAMRKPRSPQSLSKRSIKRRFRLFTLAEASNPLFRVSGMEILALLILVLIVAYIF
jgi:hypothetical protein